MKVKYIMIKKMDMVKNIIIKVIQFIKDSGRRIKSTEKGYYIRNKKSVFLK